MAERATDVLVLGIDAANPDLLEAWAADGTLPHLGSLLQRGLSGRTHSVAGFYIGATWPSLCTGVSPASHGIHYLVQLRPGTREYYRPSDAEYTRRPPFWTPLSRAGRRIAVLDVPLSRVDPTLDALQVVEWGSHDALFGFHAWPATLEREIRNRFGLHPGGVSCDRIERDLRGYAHFVDTLIEGVRRKAAVTNWVLEQERWHLVMQVFTEAHCAGHQCWHLHDPAHPAHDATVAAGIGDPLRRVYAAIDAAIGEVLAHAGHARVIVLAAHGMRHGFGAQFLLHDILFRLGAASPIVPRAASPAAPLMQPLRRVWRRLPRVVRRRLEPLRSRARRSPVVELPQPGVDLTRSPCFPVPNGLAVGGIRLNLAGREPDGVLPADQADGFCGDLSQALLDFTDERTGRPIVNRVLRTREHHAGEFLDALPDLLVEWDDTTPIGSALLAGGAGSRVRARSHRAGIIEGVNEYGRTGEHRPGGFFVAAGPGIAAGRLLSSTSILDFAPSFATLLGVRLPGAEGRVISGLCGGEPLGSPNARQRP
ncbi:MAG: alkaline phosphatase family protein [Gemmatimonadetes bacterium]|nr:alkaline phosphatase family protein [Gemmatimonadota bacterium]